MVEQIGRQRTACSQMPASASLTGLPSHIPLHQVKCGDGFASVLGLGWTQGRFLSLADYSLRRTGPQEEVSHPPLIASRGLDATFGTEVWILSLSDSCEPSSVPNRE